MKKSVGQNQRKPRFRISKLIFPIAALALIAGCTSFACIRGRVENDQPIVSNAENPEVISDANNYGRYYEYTHAWTVAISFVNHDLSSDYTTPLDYYETTNGRSGKIGTGQLTVTGTNLERKGYFHPANSFDYTSYSVGSDVSVTFNYQPPTTSSRLKEYTITDCRTKSLDGYSLPGQMGTGALLILKRRTGASSWTLDKTFVGLKPGTPVKYTPSASDIFYGTYYRFVCGYQYYYLDHEDTYWISAFNIKQYGFVDCLQRTNLFLARGKTDVRFISGHTEVKTHQLEAETYLANVTYDEDLKANCLFLNEENKIENKDSIYSFSLETESIRAGETSAYLENDVPLFHYNGYKNKSIIKKATQNNFNPDSVNGSNSSFTIYTTHPNYNLTSTFATPLIGKGLTFIQGLAKKEQEFAWDLQWNLIWQDIGIAVEDTTNQYSLSALYYSQYNLFRAMDVTPGNRLGEVYVTISYFIITVDDNVRAKYSFLEGHESDLSAFLASTTLTDGSVCFSSFTMERDDLGYKVEYAYNSDAYVELSELSHVFTKEGKYRFRVSNAFEETKYTTIYLLDVAEDNAKSAYFNHYEGHSGLLDESKRVYAPESPVPCYGRGTNFYIDASETKPGLFGRILRIHDDGNYTIIQKFEDLHVPLDGELNTIGRYCFEVNVGDPNSGGDHICYTVSFSIVDETTRVPTVNYDLLNESFFASSFNPEVYTVTYPSQGVGNFIFIYPADDTGYQEAWDFAMSLEALSMVDNGDGSYTYLGETYTSKLALFSVIQDNALTRISKTFLDIANAIKGEDHYDDITTTSLDHDVYVIEDEDIYSQLTVRPPYINGYQFVSLRTYESASVKMTHIESGAVYNIPYGVVVDEILELSGRYLVEETNWCGTRSYEVVYLKENEVITVFDIAYRDGVGFSSKTVNQNSTDSITSSVFYFKDIRDKVDDYVTIKVTNLTTGESQIYSMNDLKGKVIDSNGEYLLEVSNRIGYTYHFNLTVEGSSGTHTLPYVNNAVAVEVEG